MAHVVLPLVPDDEIALRLQKNLPNWQFEGNHLMRTFKTGGWQATLLAVNAIGHLAEAAWHHPDLAVSYARVTVSLQSHDAGGITERDFELATKIEQVIGWQPQKEGLHLEGAPKSAGYIVHD